MTDAAPVPDAEDIPTELHERDQWLMWDADADDETGETGARTPEVAEQRERFAERLAEAGIRTRRFINVPDGKKGGKANTPNHQNPDNWMGASEVDGNYGVHPAHGLFEVDIDDYDGERDTPALDALAETLTVISPHTSPDDPGHRYYRVDDDVMADVFAEFGKDGASYLNLEWGEVKREGAYTVGPGSQLDGCDKDWCDDCSEPKGGYYRIGEDEPIADLGGDDLRAILDEDPNITPDEGQTDGAKGGSDADESGSGDAFGGFPDESPDEKPLCYHNALVARRDGGHSAENDRVIDQYAGILGLNAGYDLSEVVEHFRLFAGSGGRSFDRETTQYQLASIEADGVSPVGISKLRAAGLLGEGGCSSDCPIHGGGPTASQYGIETCRPPADDAEPFDIDGRRDELYDRYQDWIDAGQPVRVWGDAPGVGKTTTATLAADAADRSHAMLLDKHAKAREHVGGGVTPDTYHHLKGGEQPAHDCCMDATAAAGPDETPDCHKHGHPSDWPRMCPVYERGKDDDLRQRYEALVGAVGAIQAHLTLGLEKDDKHPWHAEQCRWHDALEALNEAGTEYVAGVHEYQSLKTVRDGEQVGKRDLLVDEKPRESGRDETLDVEQLTRVQNRLADLGDVHDPANQTLAHNLREFAAFAEQVRDAIVADETPDLATLDAPAVRWEQRREVKDPLSGAYVERPMKDETLAQVKLEYCESGIRRVKNEEWNGEPLTFDALLAAARGAGLPDAPTRRAIAAPNALHSCPWCGSPLADANGVRVCSDDDCGWAELENAITRRDDDPARSVAWLNHGDVPGEVPTLGSRTLPPVSDLPDDGPLVLDATATRERIAGIYGEPVDEVTIEGTETFDLDDKLNLTQITNGQYHAGTIKQSESAQRYIQQAIELACSMNDRPLFGIKKELESLFEWPDNAEILHYGAARGLNKGECDAVVCIGAPHPDMRKIMRTARLFAQDHPDLDAGGEEFSTRKVAGTGTELAAGEPIYRKLRYTDENGDGRAVPTKAYSGVAGALFREAREKELVQFIHRVRPLLVGDDESAKDAYLLTNVPTDLPVDTLCSFDDLTADLATAFPAPTGALRLLEYANDVYRGDGPDGFRTETLLAIEAGRITGKVKEWHRLAQLNGEDVSLRTVRNWVSALEDTGLLTPGGYTQDEGTGYSASPAASKSGLILLSIRGGFEAGSYALSRRFREKVEASDHATEWITWIDRNISHPKTDYHPAPERDSTSVSSD